jgi:threonine dehydrogenase-like Zn-dependent dehydrogenase
MGQTMYQGRIAQFNAENEPFEIREVTLSDVGPGEVLIKVTRANICGSDLHAWHGDFAIRGLGGAMPTVLGHEMVGSVVALGDGVSTDSNGRPLEAGTRVIFPYFYSCNHCRNCVRGRRVSCLRLTMAMLGDATQAPHFVGGFGDYYLIPRNAVLYTVPDDVSDDLAAGINCALSQVLYGFDRAGLQFGESVVIQGAGGLGLYATALAKAHGASRVVVIDAVADRLELARQFGADETINIVEVDDPKQRAKLVRAFTDGYGADIVVELAGDPAVVAEGIKMLGQGGRYLEIGNIKLGRTYEADPSRLVMANKSIIGVCLYEPSVLGRAMEFVRTWKDRMPLDQLTPVTFSLDNINDAFAAADRREIVRASIVP